MYETHFFKKTIKGNFIGGFYFNTTENLLNYHFRIFFPRLITQYLWIKFYRVRFNKNLFTGIDRASTEACTLYSFFSHPELIDDRQYIFQIKRDGARKKLL